MRPQDLRSLCLASRPATTPYDLWTSWSLAPEVVLPLLLILGLYVRRLRRRPGIQAVSPWQAACFAAGWLALVVALVSPLCRMAATLAAAHMVQHVILVAVAPPLLVLGTSSPALRALARGWGRWLATPLVAGLLYGAAIWFWHAPLPYQAALLSEGIHLLMYAMLIGAALLFWRSLIAAAWQEPDRHGAMLSALATTIHTGLLGALLTFAPTPWYPLLGPRAAGWGLSALEDQQLAGLIMWVPMGSIYLVGSVVLMAAWLGAIERRRLHLGPS